MTATPIPGERMCYMVSSETGRAQGYRVDLLAHKGLGHCSCVNFGVVHYAKVKHGERSACKHLRLCQLEFAHEVIARIAKEIE